MKFKHAKFNSHIENLHHNPVPDPDHEIRGGGRVFSKKNFSALWASVSSKNKEGQGPQAPPLDPPLQLTYNNNNIQIYRISIDKHKLLNGLDGKLNFVSSVVK